MKLKLGVLLLVCLMATGTFAATIDQWIQDDLGAGVSGKWNDATKWKKSVVPAATTTTGDELKLNTWNGAGPIVTTIDTAWGDATHYNRVTVAGGGTDVNTHKLAITTGANVVFSELRIGHGNSTDKGRNGNATQDGGTLTLDKLQLGYYGSRGSCKGTYTASGGILQAKSGSTGRLMVGTGLTTGATSANNEGVFTVVGNDANVSMTELYVGGYSTYVGKGTLEFRTESDGVSPIKVSSSIILDLGGGNSVANLLVTNPGEFLGTIILVENTGASLVSGLFDSINGVAAGEGAQVTIAGGLYTLTYVYDAAGDGKNNDIALIPEPATIALLTLGLIAIRRRK